MITRRLILYVTIILCFAGCNSNNDLNGNWVPKTGRFPTLIIKDDSIVISNDYLGFIKSRYIQKNDEIILTDTIELSDWGFKRFIIKSKYADSLVVNSQYSNYNHVLVHREMKSAKFNRIRLEYFNGWSYGSIIEIDSIGNAKVWEENSDDHVRNYGAELFSSEALEALTPFANYLYSNDTLELDYGSCSDCASYLLSLQKDDTIKVFAFRGRINSVLPFITRPILNFAKKVKKDTIDISEKLPFNENLGESKTIIKRIK